MKCTFTGEIREIDLDELHLKVLQSPRNRPILCRLKLEGDFCVAITKEIKQAFLEGVAPLLGRQVIIEGEWHSSASGATGLDYYHCDKDGYMAYDSIKLADEVKE